MQRIKIPVNKIRNFLFSKDDLNRTTPYLAHLMGENN